MSKFDIPGEFEPVFTPDQKPEGKTEGEPVVEVGQPPEEIDRKAAADLRGENLTEEEFKERGEHITVLRHAIDSWIQENITEGNVEFNQVRMEELVKFLSEEHREDVDAITSHFQDERMYPRGRQIVKLRSREIGKVPDVLIFGWRGKDATFGETKIHDHGDSTVAVQVHDGAVEEHIYKIVKEEWVKRLEDGAAGHLDHEKPLTCRGMIDKRWEAGSTRTYRSPYIHTIAGTPDNAESVTIHAYMRPTTTVAYDFSLNDGQFTEIGVS